MTTILTENGGHLQVTATPGGVTIEQQGVGRVSLIRLDKTSAGRLAEQLDLAILATPRKGKEK